MSNGRILIAADSTDGAERLSTMFANAGYEVSQADSFTAPPPVDLMLIDVTRLLGSPLALAQAQRRMGCDAPAALMAARLTQDLAEALFPMEIRDFIIKPVGDDELLNRVGEVVTRLTSEREEDALKQSLQHAQAVLQRRLREMNTLSRIGRSIASLKDVDTMLAHIVDAAVYLSHADEGALFLIDDASGKLLVRAEKELGAKSATSLTQASVDSDAMTVVQTSEPVIRSGSNEHKVKTGYLVRALVNVPVIIERKVIGVLAVYNHGSRDFEEGDVVVLSNMADYAAIALDKAQSLDAMNARIDESLDVAREIIEHARTLEAPADSIEAQAETLLAGDFDPLSESQHAAVTRIRQSADRLKEVEGFIRDAIVTFESRSG